MNSKKSYELQLQNQLDEWEAEISKLRKAAHQDEEKHDQTYNKQIQELENLRMKAQQKLHEIKQTKDDNWQELKDGLSQAWNAINQSFRKTLSKFK